MQVILTSDVDHLGYAGDVVEVKKGYWRNYLRPRGLANTATHGMLADMATRMERRRAAEARSEDEANELAALLNRTVLTIPAHAGPQGKLFGSVGAADIAKSLDSARKLRIDPKKIRLDEPIKALGAHMVPMEVYPGVRAEVKTIVVASSEQLDDAQKEAIAAADAAAVAEVEAQESAAAQDEPDASAEAGEADSVEAEQADDPAAGGAEGAGAADTATAADVDATSAE